MNEAIGLTAAQPRTYLDELENVSDSDVAGLISAEKSYGDSWKKRGGVGTFMMAARKWDRIETRLQKPNRTACMWDIFEHIYADERQDGIIDDVRDLRRYLMLVEAEVMALSLSVYNPKGYLDALRGIAKLDIMNILDKEKSYGNSWKRRKGIGAFMTLARKWDRIENRMEVPIQPVGHYDIFEHIKVDERVEGVLQDVQGLRQYLIMVEAELVSTGRLKTSVASKEASKPVEAEADG